MMCGWTVKVNHLQSKASEEEVGEGEEGFAEEAVEPKRRQHPVKGLVQSAKHKLSQHSKVKEQGLTLWILIAMMLRLL